jgi:hypothetical protein
MRDEDLLQQNLNTPVSSAAYPKARPYIPNAIRRGRKDQPQPISQRGWYGEKDDIAQNPLLNLFQIVTGMAAIIIGIGSWLIGARFTIDGMIIAANWLIEFVQQPYQIEPTSTLYLWLMVFPLFFSTIEIVGLVRINRTDMGGKIIWGIILFSDVFTTGFGLLAMDPTSSLVAAWLTSSIIIVSVVAVFLTVWPEWITHWGLKTIKNTTQEALEGLRRDR